MSSNIKALCNLYKAADVHCISEMNMCVLTRLSADWNTLGNLNHP